MKKIIKNILAISSISAALFLGACKKDLDINKNPNAPTDATIGAVFPEALTATANNINQFNSYGAALVGYYANGGGVSGWGSIVSYNFSNSDYAALWDGTYKILEDIQFVIDKSGTDTQNTEFVAASKILKAYNYQLLVDTYNDIPFTNALQGKGTLLPTYDKGQDVYKALATILDEAIAAFKGATPTSAFKDADFMYAGNATKWIQLANTIKLKLIVRANGKVTFANTNFDGNGFITDDVLVNPGYIKDNGKQNRAWNSWAYTYSGSASASGSNYAPTPYILTFYNGVKLLDTARANLVFKSGTNTAANQLGYQGSDAPRGLSPSSWFRGTSATSYERVGILKGPDAGAPILLLSEAKLMQAEAALKGIISGDVKSLFEQGVTASFRYLDKDNTNAIAPRYVPATQFATYKANNASSPKPYLVDLDKATSNEQKLEAIITQKYIALNMILSHESWNDFRKTGYPVISGRTPAATFVSSASEATSPDRLPTRILYPASEFRYNSNGNIPTVDKYTSKIFWAK